MIHFAKISHEFIENTTYVINYIEENELKGYAEFKIDGRWVWLNTLFVVSEHRRKGIGKQLLQEVKNICCKAENEFSEIWGVCLGVHSDNRPAYNFYLGNDFQWVWDYNKGETRMMSWTAAGEHRYNSPFGEVVQSIKSPIPENYAYRQNEVSSWFPDTVDDIGLSVGDFLGWNQDEEILGIKKFPKCVEVQLKTPENKFKYHTFPIRSDDERKTLMQDLQPHLVRV